MLPRGVRYALAVFTFFLAAALSVSLLLNVESTFLPSEGRSSPTTLAGWLIASLQIAFVAALAVLAGWATLRLLGLRVR